MKHTPEEYIFLQLLNLSGNRLETLHGNETFKTPKIELFDLQQNQIRQVDKRLIEIMPNLREIRLANNNLVRIPDLLNEPDTMSQIQRVSIGENPLRCDCTQNGAIELRTQHWYLEHRQKIVDPERVYCLENITHALQHNDTTVLSFYPPNVGADLFRILVSDFAKQENR